MFRPRHLIKANKFSMCLADSQRRSRKEMKNTNDKLFKGKFWNWQSCKNGILRWFRYIIWFIKCAEEGKWSNHSLLDIDGKARGLFDVW